MFGDTNSVTSSRSQVTAMRNHFTSNLLSGVFPVFPYMMAMEMDAHATIVTASLFVQFMQGLAFVLNPHQKHGETLKALSYVVYAFQLPFWDASFVSSVTFDIYMVFFSIAVAMTLLTVITFVGAILFKCSVKPNAPHFVIWRILLKLMTSVLFIPLLMSFLSQIICVNGHLWAFPTEVCYNGSSTLISLIFAIISLIVLVVLALLYNITIYSQDPRTGHMMARGHDTMEYVYTMWCFLSCVLFFVFTSDALHQSTETWLDMYILFSALLLAAGYIFFLPFCHFIVNRLYVSAFLIIGVTGLIVFLSDDDAVKLGHGFTVVVPGFSKNGRNARSEAGYLDIDGMLFVTLLFPLTCLGWWLAEIRVNRWMSMALVNLVDSAAPRPPPETEYTYPKYLPAYDAAYSMYHDLCQDIADGARTPSTSVSFPPLSHAMLSAIYTSSDVEVATRFLVLIEKITLAPPTDTMLFFAASIYIKGLLRFKEYGDLTVSFALMISRFTTKKTLALQQCERCTQKALLFPAEYRAFRLHTSLSASLNLRNVAYQRLCDQAKKAHKEALILMHQLWSRLRLKQDVAQLMHIASQVAANREHGNAMFLKALSYRSSDCLLVLSYADYLEQIMLKPDLAENMRAIARDDLEAQRRKATEVDENSRGHDAKNAINRAINSAKQYYNEFAVHRVGFGMVVRYVAPVLLMLLAVAFIIAPLLMMYRRREAFLVLAGIARLRALSLAGALLVIQQYVGETGAAPMDFSASGARLNTIAAIAQDMMTVQNSITFDTQYFGWKVKENFLNSQRIVAVDCLSANTTLFRTRSVWDYETSVTRLLLDVPATLGDNASVLTADKRRVIEYQMAGQRQSALNAVDVWGGVSYNVSKQYGYRWSLNEVYVTIVVATVLYAFSILTLVVLAGFVMRGTEEAVALRRSVVSLFLLIPTEKVDAIVKTSKERVTMYDQSQADDDDQGMRGGNMRHNSNSATDQDNDDDDDLNNTRGHSDFVNRTTLGAVPHDNTSGAAAIKGTGTRGGATGAGGPNDEENETSGDGVRSDTDDYDDEHLHDGVQDQLLGSNDRTTELENDPTHVTAHFAKDLRPFTFLQFFFLILTCVFLGATLVLMAIQSPLVHRSLVNRNATLQRAVNYRLMQLRAGDVFTSSAILFTNASRNAYLQMGANLSTFLIIAQETVAQSPHNTELGSLRSILEAGDNLKTLLLRQSAIFLENPSDCMYLYRNETSLPPTNTVGEQARAALFGVSNAYQHRIDEVYKDIAAGLGASSDHLSAQKRQTLNNDFTIAGCALGCASFLSLVTLLVLLRPLRQVMLTRGKMAAHIFVLVCLLAVIACYIAHFSTSRELNGLQEDLAEALVATTKYRKFYLTSWKFATIFAQGYRPIEYEQYFDYIYSAEIPSGEYFTDAAAFGEYARVVTKMQYVQNIAMRLVASGAGLTGTPEADLITWNLKDEDDSWRVRLNYPNEPLQYNNTAYDLSLSAHTQILMGRYTITGPRFLSLKRQADAIVDSMIGNVVGARIRAENKLRTSMERGLVAFPVLLGFACAVYVAVVLISISDYYEALRKQQVFVDSSILKSVVTSSNLFRFAVLGIGALFTTIFVVCVAGACTEENLVWTSALSQDRSSLILLSMMKAEKWVGGEISLLDAQLEMSAYADRLLALFQVMHYYNGVGTEADEKMEVAGVTVIPEFSSYYNPFPNETANKLLQSGLTGAEFKWLSLISSLSTTSTDEDAFKLVKLMREVVMPLVAVTGSNANIHAADTLRHMRLFTLISVAFAAVTVVAVIITALCGVYPMIIHQEEQKNGSRTLLRVIPEDVRDSIPAIADWLAAENIEFTSSVRREKNDHTGVDAIVVTNSEGTILRFNFEAENIFGYSAAEVVGNNISMLMPERIAAFHASSLEDHLRRSAADGLVFTRRTFALHKYQYIFPMEVTVHEFTRDSGAIVFIGFFRDTTKEMKQSKEEQLNNIIQDYTTSPMIAIDSLGTVLRFNRAAEECFGHSAHDIINQNVKILMPEDIAARHDGYLATYLRTQKKHAIDRFTRTRGMRKSGDEFELEILVREIFVDDGTSTYLGFIRDLSHEVALMESINVNSSIVNFSPLSIITIDQFGKVLNFSMAASKIFGYEASEVVNNNCKMLMPPKVADMHDSYLTAMHSSRGKKTATVDREVIGRRKDGTDFPMRITTYEVTKPGISNTAFVGFVHELTEDRIMELQVTVDVTVEENHHVPLAIADSENIVRRVNRALLTEFGFRSEEVIGRNMSFFLTDGAAEEQERYVQHFVETGVSAALSVPRRVQARHKSGSVFPCELRVSVVSTVSGEPNYIAYLRNISREVRLERHTKINNVISDISPTPLIAIDQAGIVTIFSVAAEKMWRYRAEEVIGKNVSMLMLNDMVVLHDMYLEQYRKTRVKKAISRVNIRDTRDSTGRVFPIELVIREIRATRRGESNWYFACCRDLTDVGETKRIHSWNQQVMELSPVPLVQVNRNGIITMVNSAAEVELGYSQKEVIGNDVAILLAVDTNSPHGGFFDGQRRSSNAKGENGITSSVRRLKARRKNGSIFPVELKVGETRVEGDDGKTLFAGYFRDITRDLSSIRANDLSTLFQDLSPNPLVATDESGIIIMFSRAACESFRYTNPAEVIGKNVNILIPEEIAKNHEGFMTAYKKTGIRRAIGSYRSVVGRRSDGTLFPVTTMVHEIKSEISDRSIFIGCIIDKSEEMNVQHMAETSNAILALIEDVVFVIDETGTLMRVSLSTPAQFRYDSVDDLIGKNIGIFIGEEGKDQGKFVEQYIKSRRSRTLNRKRIVQAKRSDGTFFRAELSLREIVVSGSHYYIGYLHDLTATNELQEKRKLNMVIAESSPVPLIIINPAGIVRVFSAAAEAFFKFSASEVVGNNVKLLMSSEDSSRHDEYLARYLVTRVKTVLDRTVNVTAKMKNGELIPIGLRVKELPSRNGTDNGDFIGYIIDRRKEYLVPRSEKLAEVLMDTIPYPTILMTHSGLILEANHRVKDFFGYSVDELRGDNVSTLLQLASLYPDTMDDSKATTAVATAAAGAPDRSDGARGTTPTTPPRGQERREASAVAAGNYGGGAGPGSSPTSAEALRALSKEENAQAQFCRRVSVLVKKGLLCDMMLYASTLHRPSADSDGVLQRYLVFVPIKKLPDITHARQILAGLVAYTNLAMVQTDSKNIVTMMNRPVEVLLGWKAENTLNQNCKLFMSFDMARVHDMQMERYRVTRTPRVVGRRRTVPALCSDGSFINLELSLQELGDEFMAYLGVTEEKAHDNSNAALVDCISETMKDPFMVLSRDDSILAFSAKATELLGYAVDEVQNAQVLFLDGVVGPHHALTRKAPQVSVFFDAQRVKSGPYEPIAVAETQRTADVQGHKISTTTMKARESSRRTKCYKKDGSLADVQLTVREFSRVDGEHFFVAFIEDSSPDDDLAIVTDLRDALINANPNALIVIDTKGSIVQFNQMAEHVFRFSRDQVIGRNVRLLMPDSEASRHDRYMERYLQTGVGGYMNKTTKVVAERKSGELFEAELTLKEVLNESGHPTLFVGTLKELQK